MSIYSMVWLKWPSGSGAGLAINRSQVGIPATPLSSATLGKCLHACASLTKQHNMVPVNGR